MSSTFGYSLPLQGNQAPRANQPPRGNQGCKPPQSSKDNEARVIRLLKGSKNTCGVGPWDRNTERLWKYGEVQSPVLRICDRSQFGKVVVATATWGEKEKLESDWGRWVTHEEVGPRSSNMWLLIVLVGEDLETYHSIEIGGVSLVPVEEEEERRCFLIHLWACGEVWCVSTEGGFMGASIVPPDRPTRLVSTGGALPKLIWRWGGQPPEENPSKSARKRWRKWRPAKPWVTPDQGATLGEGIPMPPQAPKPAEG